MRIATLANASVVHTRRWVQEFRSRGHEVGLWSLEPGPAVPDARMLPAARLPGVLRYPLSVPALKRELKAFRPHLVDAHYVPNYGLMGALSGFRPLSVTAWGSDLLLAGPRNAFQRARTRYVLGAADLVIADSGNLAEAARRLGAHAERVFELPWGIDVQRFSTGAAREPGLLISTRMHEPVYDLPTLFRGLAPVMAQRPSVRLVVAGDGRLTGELKRLAARLLPAERVTFTGRTDAPTMADLLARAEVALSASRSDSTSVSLLESMASGALPVVSNIEGNREWVEDGEGAAMFEPGDAAGVTRAVERVLDDAEWAARARKHNRKVVLARADAAANMARVEQLFQTLARGESVHARVDGAPGGRPA